MDLLLPIIVWWLAVTVIGWVALPLAWRLFPSLPDRGYGFIRPLGLLMAGYVYWLGGMAGVVPNSTAGAWFVLAGLVFLAALLVQHPSQRAEILSFLRTRRRMVIGYELLFLVAFVGWAFYRAYNPNIETSGGEKYMEMAFISAVLESPQFPPLDPWLSGHSISYYYFGYIIAGFLIHLTGVTRFVAFNLLTPMTLGMTLCAAFSIGYNLVAFSGRATRRWRIFGGAFTAYLLALAGSLEGLLELGFLRGWGPARLYDWLDVRNLTAGVQSCGDEAGKPVFGYGATVDVSAWVPTRFIWWWRGSRVIHDNCGEIIHEFPFFSFMLADVHPHITALPYALVVIGLALAVLAGALDREDERPLWSPRWLMLPLIVGSLGFFNTWDLPTYAFVLVCAYALRTLARPAASIAIARKPADLAVALLGLAGVAALAWRLGPVLLNVIRDVPPEAQPVLSRVILTAAAVLLAGTIGSAVWRGAERGQAMALRIFDTGRFTIWLAVLSIALYLPFHIGFQSQVAGLGVVGIRTRFPQWLVHFGLLFALAISLVAVYLPAVRSRLRRPTMASLVLLGLAIAVVIGGLFLQAWTAVILALTVAAAGIAGIELWAGEAEGDLADQSSVTSTDPNASTDPPPPAVLGEGAGGGGPAADYSPASPLPIAATFALGCVAIGLLLPLGTEFVFIRDLFNSRMNTIFKLYYQAWTLLAIGGGYAVYAVWRRWPRPAAAIWSVPVALLVLGSTVYPLAATYDRTNRLTVRSDAGPQSGLSLDGLRWWKSDYPEDLEAAEWIRANVPQGTTILETFGGGYEHNGRLSMASGRPTVLGWEGHEHQWRGVRDEIDPRKADIETMYKSADKVLVEDLLDRYGVRYIVLSDAERAKFTLTPADDRRFEDLFGPPVWTSQNGKVMIFERN
jgi:YYY domain-containing protein